VFSFCHIASCYLLEPFFVAGIKRLWALLSFWHDVLCVVILLKNKYIHNSFASCVFCVCVCASVWAVVSATGLSVQWNTFSIGLPLFYCCVYM